MVVYITVYHCKLKCSGPVIVACKWHYP